MDIHISNSRQFGLHKLSRKEINQILYILQSFRLAKHGKESI